MIKRLITPLSITLFIITCGVFGWHHYVHYSITPAYEKKLSAIALDRAHEIAAFLNTQEKSALELSQEQTIIDALHNFSAQKLPNKTGSQKLISLISSHKETMGFKNILLIDKHGTILFSSTKKDLAGVNLQQDAYTSSSLGKSYERASMTLTNDYSLFNFNDLLEEPALFITIPILDKKKFIGTATYQLDQEKIYLIANQYIDLEKTGEVLLGRKDGEYAVYLSPTRNDPDLAFKKRALFTHPPLSIQASILGQEGSGTAIDYRGKPVVGAWKFIPKLDWGMIVKIDLDEIIEPTNFTYNLFLLFLILFMICMLVNIYLFFPLIQHKIKKINSTPPFNKIPSLIKDPVFIFLLLFLGLAVKNIIQCEIKTQSTIEKSKKEAQENISKNADAVESLLKKIEFVAQSIADDLRTNYLKKDDIPTRIKRDSNENKMITYITVLFTPTDGTAAKIHTHPSITQDTVDETTQSESDNILKTKWYTQAVEKGSIWLVNPINDTKPTATYARTFSDKNNQSQGVIAITFSLKPIIRTVEYSGIGQTGYSVIMSDTGSFIFHPTSTIVQSKTTLLQYAQARGNEELASIAQKITEGKPLIDSYSSESTKETFWICTQPIKINNWIIGSLFSEDEIGLSSQIIRHYYFWILVWITITILLLFALLWQYAIISLTTYAIIANAICLLALIISWQAIKKTTTINRETRTIITDQSNLNKFLNDLKDEAQRKHEAPPIIIPCGILLYSLSITDPDHISISGYLWNKYNTKLHTTVSRGMDLPQATKITFGHPLNSQTGNIETSTITIQGLLFQEQNYAKYPFDQQQIRIVLEHRDIERNIILTPDLSAYKKISPESTPGLDKEFTLPGFTIEQTFFEYRTFDPTANFGFKEFGKVTDHFQLIYNAIMNRNLLNPFVLYLLPLLVILFSLFSTLLVTSKNTEPLAILGGYTGLFFALIVLQRSLREAHPAGTTLYMEYAFFYTYLTLILLVIHTILMYYYKKWESYQNKSLYFLRILFWPFQFVTWLITTLIVFY